MSAYLMGGNFSIYHSYLLVDFGLDSMSRKTMFSSQDEPIIYSARSSPPSSVEIKPYP